MAIPPIPIPLDQLLAYRNDLTDALTGEPVTSSTELACLHSPDLRTLEGRLIQNLTNIARPSEPVHLITSAGHVFPPQEMEQGWLPPRFWIFVTTRRLFTAPSLRLEVVWEHFQVPGAPQNLTVAVDFHFNAMDDGTPGLCDLDLFKVMDGFTVRDEMRFTSHGATSEGFPLAMKYQALLGHHGRTMLQILHGFLSPGKKQRIRLAFGRSLNAGDSEGFLGVLGYIVTGQLPSLSAPAEWTTLVPLKAQRDLTEMMYDSASPYPMVPFECGDTHATITDAAVELYESSRVSHLEQEVSLREWTSVSHDGILYEIGGLAVIAVRFRPFRPLGGAQGFVKFDLPDRLQVKMSWTCPVSGAKFSKTANKVSVPIRLPAYAYDALFVIAEPTQELLNACIKPLDLDKTRITPVEFSARTPRFSRESQLNTAINLLHPDAGPWHELIKNQSHDFPVVDLATKRVLPGTEPAQAAVDEAFQKMMQWRPWNKEQISALHSIRSALAGIVLIAGPAGTGKTLVTQAIVAFLNALGLHVMFLAPANSNCADFLLKLKQNFPHVPATRVFPASADDHDPEKTGKQREAEAQGGLGLHAEEISPAPDPQEAVGDLFNFELIRADMESTTSKYSDEAHGLAAQVLKAARESKYPGEPIWDELRQCVEKSDAGEFEWLDKKKVKSYAKVYKACKAQFLSQQKLVVTTTGNVRTADVRDNFARDKHGVICQGLVVVIDEACKDREIDTLSACLLPEWRQKITGFIGMGDPSQLAPTNTSASGRVTFNPFSERLSLPLMTRLQRQGFPCVELREQHRMHRSISSFPNREFYASGLRDGLGTSTLLSKTQPGLFACLKGILDSVGGSHGPPRSAKEEDSNVRTSYIQVLGRRDNSKRSPVVREHIRFFFDCVYWPLHAYYQEHFSDEVMIIVAYKGSKMAWLEAVGHIQQKYGIPSAQLPRILTIDSSQGCEASITVIDASVQRYSQKSKCRDIGFVDDDRRINVAMTRAKSVRWIIGGSCSVGESRRAKGNRQNTPSYVRYREEVENTPELTITPRCALIPKGDDSWLDGLEKKDVSLAVRYADEMKA